MLGFFVGGILGALIIFFLGTKEGKKARKAIEEKGQDALDDVMVKLDEFQEKGKDLVREGEELKEKVVDQLETQKEKLTEDTAQKLDTALSHIEAIQERGRQTTAGIRKRLFKNTPKKS